jgi:amidase
VYRACASKGKGFFGRVSRHGVFPLAESLDHVGPIARCTVDAAALLGAIAGWDPRDLTARREPIPDYLARLDQGIAGVRIGVDEHYCTHSVDPEVGSAVLATAEVPRDCGEVSQRSQRAEDPALATGGFLR